MAGDGWGNRGTPLFLRDNGGYGGRTSRSAYPSTEPIGSHSMLYRVDVEPFEAVLSRAVGSRGVVLSLFLRMTGSSVRMSPSSKAIVFAGSSCDGDLRGKERLFAILSAREALREFDGEETEFDFVFRGENIVFFVGDFAGTRMKNEANLSSVLSCGSSIFVPGLSGLTRTLDVTSNGMDCDRSTLLTIISWFSGKDFDLCRLEENARCSNSTKELNLLVFFPASDVFWHSAST